MMMARIGNVGPEAFPRTDRISNGLSAAMRDHMAINHPSRVDMLLGVASRPQSPPVYDTTEFDEEDVWAAGDSKPSPDDVVSNGNSSGSSVYSNVVTIPAAGSVQLADAKKFDMSIMGGSSSLGKEAPVSDSDPFRFMNTGRRWLGRDKEPALSMTYTDRSRGFVASSLSRAAPPATVNGTTSGMNGVTSRFIPTFGDTLYTSSPGGRGSSAPVNVPDWSKILGVERKEAARGTLDDSLVPEDDEDEEERLPPHELVARESARSQATNSMLEGAGRTLKGRDQSRVRNAILRSTGFLVDN